MNPNTKAKDILNDIDRINQQTKKLEETRKNLEKGF